MSIVRIGLTETKGYGDGYDAIFKKGMKLKLAKPTATATKPAAKKKAATKVAAKPTAKKPAKAATAKKK